MSREPQRPPPRIALRADGGIRLFLVADILWIGADGHCAILHLRGGVEARVRRGLGAHLRVLPADTFSRINRSGIVNLRAVSGTEHRSNGDHVLTLGDGRQLVLSRTRPAEVLRRLLAGG